MWTVLVYGFSLTSNASPFCFLLWCYNLAEKPFIYVLIAFSHELNVSVQQSGFTINRKYKPVAGDQTKLQFGDIIRFYHKEMEAYLVAEGLFDDEICEDGNTSIITTRWLKKIKTSNSVGTTFVERKIPVFWHLSAIHFNICKDQF